MEYMCAALRAGKNVVTANKQLMSERYGELVQLARENHVALRCSAAVGGGIRWLTNLESTLDVEPVLRVSGIMNGTTNYILDTMTTSGLKFEDALRQAQALGYAEVDPTEDLNGADARRKLVISTNVAFGCVVQEPEVTTFGIAGIRACDIGAARKMHRVVKLMASARLLDSGDVACYLEPAMMPQGMHEAAVPENFNLISITGMHIGKQSFYGQGAGRFPTAYNVMQDCLDIRNGLIMMVSVLLFTVVGSYIASLLPSHTMGSFSVFMTFLLGIKFIVKPVMTTRESMQSVSAGKRAIQSVFCGIIIGFICGFVGAGGGMMMLLILTSVLGYELKTAVGTSVFIMTFTALTGAVSHFAIGGAPDWRIFALCVIFTLIWARIAAVLANKADAKTLNRVTGIVLVVLGIAVFFFNLLT